MFGTITKKTPYKSGSGFFIGIDNGSKDYMYYGGLEAQIGDKVEYETGISKTGSPTLKTCKKAESIPYVDAPPIAHKLNPDSKPIVTRLSCLSSASDLVGDLIRAGIVRSVKEATHETLQLARAYEKWAMEGGA